MLLAKLQQSTLLSLVLLYKSMFLPLFGFCGVEIGEIMDEFGLATFHAGNLERHGLQQNHFG